MDEVKTMTTGGPIVGLSVYAPSDTPAQLTLRLKVRAKVRNGDKDWKKRLLRELHHLMPGITEAKLQMEIGAGYHLAIKYGNCGMTVPRWRKFTKDTLNDMIAEINPMFVLALGQDPSKPLHHIVACRGRVSPYDIELMRSVDGVRGVFPETDPQYCGEAVVVYAPTVAADEVRTLKLALQNALRFQPYV